ncbi:MAG: YhjD/YihY/BrkB family envelope integrity protein, partial [Desulfofustis sp.]
MLICLREMKGNLLTVRAGYLTYALLLSMVPILAMSTAVVKGLGGGNQLREVVYSYVDTLSASTPAQAEQSAGETASVGEADAAADAAADLTSHLRAAVDKIFDYVDRTNFATLGTFGMVGIFVSVILVLGQIEKSLNII